MDAELALVAEQTASISAVIESFRRLTAPVAEAVEASRRIMAPAVEASRQFQAMMAPAVEASRQFQAVTALGRRAARALALRARRQAIIERRKEDGQARAAAFEALAWALDRLASRLALGTFEAEDLATVEVPGSRRVLCLDAPGSPHRRSRTRNLGTVAAA